MGDPPGWGDLPADDSGCRYILDNGKACGIPTRRRSYCAEHYAICYLTPEEAKVRAREFDAYAEVVGGRFKPGPLSRARLNYLEWKAQRVQQKQQNRRLPDE